MSIDCFYNKKEAKEKTQENIDKEFWTVVKNQINDRIAKAIKNGESNIQLDEEYIKYFYLIRLYYKKDKKYKVSKTFYGPFCEFWSGIEINWED